MPPGLSQASQSDVAIVESLFAGEVTGDQVEDLGVPATDYPNPNSLMGDSAEPVVEPQGDVTPEVVEEPELDDEVELSEQQPKGKGAQARIRKLAAERTELRAKLQQFEQNSAQKDQQLGQYLQNLKQQSDMQVENLKQQMEMQRQELDRLRYHREEEEEKNLAPLDQFTRGLEKKIRGQATDLVSSQLAPLQKQLEAERAQLAEYRANEERRARVQYFRDEAQKAGQEQLLTGFSEKSVSELAPQMQEMILTYSAAYGVKPDEAARQIKKTFDTYHSAKLQQGTTTNTLASKNKALAPSPTPTTRTAAGRRDVPQASRAELRANGYDNYFQWSMKGYPSLKKKP